MLPPGSVYFAAFVRRFVTICSSLVGSAFTRIGPVAIETFSSWFFSWMRGDADSTARVTTGPDVQRLLLELDLAAIDAGDVEQVVDHVGQVLDLPRDDLLRPRDGLRVGVGPEREPGGVADGGEGIPQLVGEHREEFVLAAVGLPAGLLRPELGRPVAEDLDEARSCPGIVLERAHDPVAPEAAAVLPHVPSLVVRPALGERLPGFLLGLALLAVFRREDDVGRLADELGLRPPHEPFGTDVPAT